MSGSPLSDAARLTERIRPPNYGTLDLDLTVNDPKVYMKPWTGKMAQKLDLDSELIDEICLENEKSYERMQAVRTSGGVSGRWSAGGNSVFVLRQAGDVLTGQIEVKAGKPVYKIVDGMARDGRIHFFVLQDAPNDPEVKANGGNPFHNVATGTFAEDEIDISGFRENTNSREDNMKRISDK